MPYVSVGIKETKKKKKTGVFNRNATKSSATGTANDAIFPAALLTILFSKVCHFIMERYTNQQRVEIIKIYCRNSESVPSTLRGLSPIYGRKNRPSRSTIERLVEKFASTGTVQNVPVPVRQKSARSVENFAAAEASVEESPNVSVTRRSHALEVSVMSLWRF